jgi:phospholipid-binding lipoprotein MlaA
MKTKLALQNSVSLTRRVAALACVMAGLMALGGCASGPTADPRDPWEPMNRSVTKFNDAVDDAVIKPVAKGYTEVVPRLVRTGVTNFFDNIGDAWSAVNSLLQFKMQAAVDDTVRFGINSTFGIGGVFDVASDANIERHKEDFGQTLGRWGVPTGPYLVLPVLGPSTLRDTAALPVDFKGDLVHYVDNDALRYSLTGLRVIDKRAGLLRFGSLLEDAALDKYSFTRDVYLQVRRSKIYDGDEPADNASSPAQK